MSQPSSAKLSAEGERIAKFLARAGVCSRRDGERLIAEGRVKLNGVVLDTPAVKVGPADKVSVDGRPVGAAEATRLWRFHKPAGLVTTHRDPAGRPTVFERLPPDLPRVISVGRLDLTSEGLLLLTNDGELARRLELPSNGWLRRYRARAYGRVTQQELDTLQDGITVEGVRYGPIEAKLERAAANSWITLSLTEGKNREVRRVLDALGLKVNRLIRIAYGPFQLATLAPGAVEEVPRRVLKDQLGKDV
jgi:23S rRNA pseudouridine2605 synthase